MEDCNRKCKSFEDRKWRWNKADLHWNTDESRSACKQWDHHEPNVNGNKTDWNRKNLRDSSSVADPLESNRTRSMVLIDRPLWLPMALTSFLKCAAVHASLSLLPTGANR